jgi:sphinganine-1-phosphate aldolase
VDVKHLESLIDSNTIMISGSAPCFPYGTIDPIPKLAQIAKKRNVGMHVDACLGGFVVAFAEQLKLDIPFNFKIDGVTSISIDHHKYGLAPKGVSGLFFKTKELRGSGFFSYSDWCGGAYATPSMLGSRSGIATAGAWFVMNTITREGYKENARKLMETVVQTADQLRADGRIEVFGDPRICVVSFRPKDIGSYKLSSFLGRERGWELSSLHRPEGIHISVTPSNQEKVRTNLVKDVKDGITAVIREPEKYKGSTEALYGGTANIPDTNVRESILKLILSSYLK